MGVPRGLKRKYKVLGTQKGIFFQPPDNGLALKRLKIDKHNDGSESWQEDELLFQQIRGVSFEGSIGRRGVSMASGVIMFLAGLVLFLALAGIGLQIDGIVILLLFFVVGGLFFRRRKSGYWQVISPSIATETLGEWQIAADNKGKLLAESVRGRIERSPTAGFAPQGRR